jgi:hypothetical protein
MIIFITIGMIDIAFLLTLIDKESFLSYLLTEEPLLGIPVLIFLLLLFAFCVIAAYMVYFDEVKGIDIFANTDDNDKVKNTKGKAKQIDLSKEDRTRSVEESLEKLETSSNVNHKTKLNHHKL